jgi:hypothetical protein
MMSCVEKPAYPKVAPHDACCGIVLEIELDFHSVFIKHSYVAANIFTATALFDIKY